MVNLSTTCQQCIFAIYDNKLQTGCRHGALESFEKAGASIKDVSYDGKTSKIIDRVCMYRRHEGFSGDVTKEIIPKSNFVINHSGDLEKLENTVRSIQSLPDFEFSCKKIVICTDSFQQLVKFCENNIVCEFEVVKVMDNLYEGIANDESFRRCTNGYICFVNSGDLVPDVISVLNKAINIDMKKVLVVCGEVQIYSAILYKFLNGNKIKDVREKIDEMMKLIESDHVFNWRDLND